MSAAKTTVCNQALSHLGTGLTIANIESDQSEAARACRTFFDDCVEACLRDGHWPFANKTVSLSLVTSSEDDSHPTEEWDYSYRMPSDCLFFRRIPSGSRNDSRKSRIPTKLSRDDGGQLIFCDIENAKGEYTMKLMNPGYWPADFRLAVSFRLAHYIAPRVTKGDPFKLMDRMLQLYQIEIGQAQSNATNEEQREEPTENEYTAART